MNAQTPLIGSIQKVWMYAVAFLALQVIAPAEEQPPQAEPIVRENSAYVFKPIAITPSPSGDGYNGRFLFVNQGPSAVMVSGFDKPRGGKFELRFVRYQRLENGVWKDVEVGYCGTGAEDFAMKPGKPYEFHAYLDTFPEQDAPLTARIGFDVSAGDEGGWIEYWSYPFVLDWKKDRESGEFAKAKKEHYEKLRAAFSKSGFKEELLVGDDFCSRILLSMMNEPGVQEPATSFKPFLGKLEVFPDLQLDGSVRIDFESEKDPNIGSRYKGWFRLDPRKFNPQWLSEAVEKHIEVVERGDNSTEMKMDDGSSWDSPLYLDIICYPGDKSNVPTEKEALVLFTRMLGVLKKSLKE